MNPTIESVLIEKIALALKSKFPSVGEKTGIPNSGQQRGSGQTKALMEDSRNLRWKWLKSQRKTFDRLRK